MWVDFFLLSSLRLVIGSAKLCDSSIYPISEFVIPHNEKAGADLIKCSLYSFNSSNQVHMNICSGVLQRTPSSEVVYGVYRTVT